jgi:hypothetical protein
MAREDDKINTNDQPKNNATTPSDSTNPFIRFRHYADEQVSSVLQGIIGIPSILSRPTGNQQWAVFDEELRRRDELQARQRKLKEAAERIQKNESSNKVDEIERTYESPYRSPDNQSMPQELQSTDWERPSAEDAARGGVKTARGTSGYSDSHGILSQLHGNLLENLSTYQFALYSPMRPTMTSSGPVSHLVNQIIGSMSPMVFGTTSSSLSLLPYLMASPYSPLQLSLNQTLRREMGISPARSPTQTAPNDFPYLEAFEDLLLSAQGKEMPDRKKCAVKGHSADVFSSLNNGIVWIDRLRTLGLLNIPNPDEHESDNKATASFDKTQGSPVKMEVLTLPAATAASEKGGKDPETEEEMYESFLAGVSATPAQFFSSLESTFSAVERLMKSTTRGFEDSHYISQEQVRGSGNKQSPSDAEKEVVCCIKVSHTTDEDGSTEAETTVYKLFADGRDTFTSDSRLVPTNDTRAGSPSLAKTPETASDREVSSSSTVEHETDEDGVTTTITVSKTFADGRKTVTTSSHFTNKPGNERAGVQEGGSESAGEQQGEKKVKKGWFWN